jgi:glucose-6-phosphate isomerase
MKTLFDNDPSRFEKMLILFNELLFDYSKNSITDETKKYLIELIAECNLKSASEAMFNGEKINETENCAVLHTALRKFSDTPIIVDSAGVMPEIKKVQ